MESSVSKLCTTDLNTTAAPRRFVLLIFSSCSVILAAVGLSWNEKLQLRRPRPSQFRVSEDDVKKMKVEAANKHNATRYSTWYLCLHEAALNFS